jgi:pimeloyl-ACP methyl ester carboxylesterase
MTGRIIRILAFFILLLPQAQASVVKEIIELPTCSLQLRIIKASEAASGPRIIMMDGVPLSGAVFQNLGDQLSVRLDATSILIDFPGVGGSSLNGKHYGWSPLRECLRQYLATQPPSIIVLGDLAMPVVAPLLHELPKIQALVVLNSVIKPSEVHPPFPLSFMRCCPRTAVLFGTITPGVFFKKRIRDVGLGRPDKVSQEEIDSLYAGMRENHGLRRLARLVNDIELDEETDRLILDGLATPIPQLFLWGEADPALGSEYKKLPAFTANQHLIVIQQAKHFLMMDYADELAEAIAAWHARHP